MALFSSKENHELKQVNLNQTPGYNLEEAESIQRTQHNGNVNAAYLA